MDLGEYLDAFTRRDWQETATDGGTVRLALVGLGWWTREEAIPAIRRTDLCEATVAVSGDPGKAERVAADEDTIRAGITYGEFHDGAAADAYDAVYVCTPNALHREYVETAADLGKAVLCEKPVEADLGRAEGLVAAAREAGIVLMVAYRMHTEPAVRRLREAVADGALGEPTATFGHMTQPLLDRIPDPDQWRLDPSLAGPGASVTDLGIYPINTARFVLGEDPVAVQAAMDSGGGAFADVPDERATFTLRFAGGTLAACGASQNAALSSQLRIVGTAGEAVLEPAFFPSRDRRLRLSRGERTVETTVAGVDQMTEEFDYFADCLLAGRDPVADGEHALVDARTIEAAYEAAERGERVDV